MELLQFLMLALIAFVVTALDVTMFFILVRMMARASRARWVRALDAAGAPVVEYVTGALENRAPGFVRSNEGLRLPYCLFVLSLARGLLALLVTVL